jgi:mercuric ion transport protein
LIKTDDTNWAFTGHKTEVPPQMTAQKESLTSKGFWKRHLDKIGVGGSLFAALCCLGFPALVSILSAIGLGFLINDDILRPLLIVFLLVAVFGLALGMRHHGSPWALIVGTLSAVTAYVLRGDRWARHRRTGNGRPVERAFATAPTKETTKMTQLPEHRP